MYLEWLISFALRWQPSGESEAYNVPHELKRTLEAMRAQMHASPHRDFLECLHHNYICRMKSVIFRQSESFTS